MPVPFSTQMGIAECLRRGLMSVLTGSGVTMSFVAFPPASLTLISDSNSNALVM